MKKLFIIGLFFACLGSKSLANFNNEFLIVNKLLKVWPKNNLGNPFKPKDKEIFHTKNIIDIINYWNNTFFSEYHAVLLSFLFRNLSALEALKSLSEYHPSENLKKVLQEYCKDEILFQYIYCSMSTSEDMLRDLTKNYNLGNEDLFEIATVFNLIAKELQFNLPHLKVPATMEQLRNDPFFNNGAVKKRSILQLIYK